MWGGRIKTTSKSRAVAIKTEKKKKNLSCLNILFLNMTNFFRVFSQVLLSALHGSVKPVEMCSGLQHIN